MWHLLGRFAQRLKTKGVNNKDIREFYKPCDQGNSNSQKEMRKTNRETMPAPRPPPLYIPRAISDLMLALSKNSTSVYYRCGHVCVKHQAVVDLVHI